LSSGRKEKGEDPETIVALDAINLVIGPRTVQTVVVDMTMIEVTEENMTVGVSTVTEDILIELPIEEETEGTTVVMTAGTDTTTEESVLMTAESDMMTAENASMIAVTVSMTAGTVSMTEEESGLTIEETEMTTGIEVPPIGLTEVGLKGLTEVEDLIGLTVEDLTDMIEEEIALIDLVGKDTILMLADLLRLVIDPLHPDKLSFCQSIFHAVLE